ncbi:MAG TPA: glycosyltransferase family 2 protein [Phycisphaerae bacterium]|nr:glycosyltransferase family 2 protein [Phycisphaerae bacterium]HOJ76050.1 glycosyltransferase family 2 protein [Phycisphaerae bacterium]HOM53091.1 glycosyltransferase family 2 protein [Phycisphaerae bacterium]HON68174.1 glycosyltransferase family 2 protein [Phycisphaerae bacterium]HOQ87982.1 glycosyltransferase family 2 protein [Phycisphaerae bacterium]
MRFLVAVPIYNEAATVRQVLGNIRRYASDILVVDDGSTDETPSLLAATPSIQCIRHHHNLGYGQSLIDAFQYAIDHGYDWVVTIDCDEQHEPARIPAFIREARRDDADIISGSRYMQSSSAKSQAPADRKAINQTITDLLNEILKLGITDAFCGFKAYRTAALARLNLTVPGYGMPLQLWVQAARLGLRIREIPVSLIYKDPNRQFGDSLDNPTARLLYYYEVLIHALAEQMPLPAGECSGCPGPTAGTAECESQTEPC